jgi:transcriptional regulator with XRE-family HTH domain
MRYDGAKLQAARLAAGINAKELAKRAKVSPTALYRIERGQTKTPHPETMLRLARTLGVELRELLNGGE